jgi:hypothetical protein
MQARSTGDQQRPSPPRGAQRTPARDSVRLAELAALTPAERLARMRRDARAAGRERRRERASHAGSEAST